MMELAGTSTTWVPSYTATHSWYRLTLESHTVLPFPGRCVMGEHIGVKSISCDRFMPANVVIPKQIKISIALLLHGVTTRTNPLTLLLH